MNETEQQQCWEEVGQVNILTLEEACDCSLPRALEGDSQHLL